jgi:hypothetical protein
LIIKRWPLRPKPHQYQLLYSWIERLAEVYGISYQRFCKGVLGLTPEEISNLRTILPEKALFILSNGTGVPIDDLRKRDLHTMFKIMFDEIGKIVEEHPEEFVYFFKQKCPQTVNSYLWTAPI